MKTLAIVLTLSMLLAVPGYADTRYISGVLKITLRTGPGTDHRVLTMIETGKEVEVIEASNPDWTRVRLSNGKEGWIMSRFLTTDRPVPPAEDGHQDQVLAGRVDELLRENESLAKEISLKKAELTRTRNKLAVLERTYRKKENESTNHTKLQSRYRQVVSNLAEQTRRADSLSQKIEKNRFSDQIKWFLSGAGVMLLGFLLGLGFRSKRRRSSLL